MQRAIGPLRDSEDWAASLGPAGQAIGAWKADIEAHLGGADSISSMERVVLDNAARTALILYSVDDYLARNLHACVDKRTRSLRPIVLQRQTLADSLNRSMIQLGLKRREKSIPSLQEYLESRGREEGD